MRLLNQNEYYKIVGGDGFELQIVVHVPESDAAIMANILEQTIINQMNGCVLAQILTLGCNNFNYLNIESIKIR